LIFKELKLKKWKFLIKNHVNPELLRNYEKLSKKRANKYGVPRTLKEKTQSLFCALLCVPWFRFIFNAILTYLKLSGCKQGLLLNFNVKMMKKGIKSYVL